MIVNGDGEQLLGSLLADHILIEFVFDGPGRRDVGKERLGDAAAAFLLIDDRLAQLDALTANVNVAGPFHQRADVAIALATEGAIRVSISPGIPGRTPSARSHTIGGCPRIEIGS